jgi:hypothetical protein
MADYIPALGGCDHCQTCAPNNACAALAPVITSSPTASGATGSAFSYTITATNTPTSFLIVAGTFIPGTSLNTSTGVLSGTPPSGYAGTYVMTLQATNACGSGTMVLTVTITGTGGGGGGIDCDCFGISLFGYDGTEACAGFTESQTLGSALTCDTVVILVWNVALGSMILTVKANGATVYTSSPLSADGSDFCTLPAGTTTVQLIAECSEGEGVFMEANLACP